MTPFLVFFVEIVHSIIVNEILDSFDTQQDFDLWDVFQPIKLKTTHKFVESQAAKAVVGQTIY